MSHPPYEHNPHAWQDIEGNPVTLHGTPAPAGTEQEADESWQETDPDGTDSSGSSDTAEKSSPSPERKNPKPAPDAEPPSESDQTAKSTARSTDGDGTEPKTTRTRRSTGKQ